MVVLPKGAMNSNQEQRSSYSGSSQSMNLQLEYTQTVCSNHGQQVVNYLNSNASLSVGSTIVYNKKPRINASHRLGYSSFSAAGREAVLKDIITFVGRSTQRGEMQGRVAAPQRPSVCAVSELCTGLESLPPPWTCSQHEAEMKRSSTCGHSCTLWNKITFTSKSNPPGVHLNHMIVVQRGNLR